MITGKSNAFNAESHRFHPYREQDQLQSHRHADQIMAAAAPRNCQRFQPSAQGTGFHRITIDGVEVKFELSAYALDDSIIRLSAKNTFVIGSKYIIWNLKNFLASRKLDATTLSKEGIFLGQIFPKTLNQ